MCAGEDWREVSTLDLVPGDTPGLLLLVGAGPAARTWACAAAPASGPPGSCSPGMEPGRVAGEESAEGRPSSTGTEVREPTPQTAECSIGTAGGRPDAEIPTGSEARHCGKRPLRIHVVHVCGSVAAAGALRVAEDGAAWSSQAGAARPRTAIDPSGRWATLREVGSLQTCSVSSDCFLQSGSCGGLESTSCPLKVTSCQVSARCSAKTLFPSLAAVASSAWGACDPLKLGFYVR